MTLSKLIREYEEKVADCDTLLAIPSLLMPEDRAAINARRQAYFQFVCDLKDVVEDTHTVDLRVDAAAV